MSGAASFVNGSVSTQRYFNISQNANTSNALHNSNAYRSIRIKCTTSRSHTFTDPDFRQGVSCQPFLSHHRRPYGPLSRGPIDSQVGSESVFLRKRS